jgi:hypothetical protein
VALVGVATATFGWVGLGSMLTFGGLWLAIQWRNAPAWVLLSQAGLASLAVGLIVVALAVPGDAGGRRAQCQNNLKHLALAIHAYHSTYGRLPPAHYADATGKPIHSWRVVIWPFCASTSIYERYRFAEPWDGPGNRTLHSDTYLHSCLARLSGASDHTSYLAIVGDNAAFRPGTGRKLDELDSTRQTILLLEHDSPNRHWMAPGDLSFDEALTLLTAENSIMHDSGGHPVESFFFVPISGRHAAMGDGSVRFLPSGLPHDVARRLLQVRKDAPITEDEILTSASRFGRPNWGNWLRVGIFLLLASVPAVYGWLARGVIDRNTLANGRRLHEDGGLSST